MRNNRQYELMASAARQKLVQSDPAQVSARTGLGWDNGAWEAVTLGTPIRITWPECQIAPALEMWHELTILQYLASARGAAPAGRFLPLSEFRSGGLARGTSFDRENDRTIARIGLHDSQAIRQAAAGLGGKVLEENGDLTFLFQFLPRIPIKLSLWLADEDFPASGKVLFDAGADRDLQVEAAGTAAGILLAALEKALNSQAH